jgi:hypothetical protein
LAAVFACGPPESPEARVADLRSEYTAKLNGFAVKEQPTAGAADEGMAREGAQAAADETGAPAAGEMAQAGDMAPSVAVRQTAILDILVSRKGRKGLPGLTVDITEADPKGDEKGHWRAYLDVSHVLPGADAQISYTLHDVDYEQGDGFNVEVLHPVPAADRGEYKELREAGKAGGGQ